MQGRSSAVVDVVDPGAGGPQLLRLVVAAPSRGGSRLVYARAVLPAPHLSPRTTTSAHAASARARPGSAGGTLRAALASERPQAQRRGSHLQFLRAVSFLDVRNQAPRACNCNCGFSCHPGCIVEYRTCCSPSLPDLRIRHRIWGQGAGCGCAPGILRCNTQTCRSRFGYP